MGKVAEQRQARTRNWLWASCLVLFCAGSAVLAQTAIEVRELLEWGDNEMALERAEKGLEQTPEDAELKFYHALALARTGETGEALDAFKKLAVQYPDRPEVHNNLAVLYAQQGNYDEARASLEAALNTDKVYSTAHKNLADIYSAQAAAAYNRALARGEQRDVPKPQLSLLSDWGADTAAPATATAGKPPQAKPKAAEKPQVAEKPAKEKAKPAADKAESKPVTTSDSKPAERAAAKQAPGDKPVEAKAVEKAKSEAAAEAKPETPRRPTTLKDLISAAEAAGAKVVYPDGSSSEDKNAGKKADEDLKLISTKAEAADADKAADKDAVETAKADAAAEAPVVAPQEAQRAARAVENWAAAWRSQDVDAYLGAYADFFRPEEGLKHDDWVAERRDRVSSPKFIRLTLQNLRIRLKGEGRAIANFRQDYQSDSYQDSVDKVLYLERIKGEWRIVREVSR